MVYVGTFPFLSLFYTKKSSFDFSFSKLKYFKLKFHFNIVKQEISSSNFIWVLRNPKGSNPPNFIKIRGGPRIDSKKNPTVPPLDPKTRHFQSAVPQPPMIFKKRRTRHSIEEDSLFKMKVKTNPYLKDSRSYKALKLVIFPKFPLLAISLSEIPKLEKGQNWPTSPACQKRTFWNWKFL